MSEKYNFKKLEMACDDLEKRIYALEKSNKKNDCKNAYEERQTLVVRENPFKKYFVVNANEDCCAALSLEFGQEGDKVVNCSIFCGDYYLEERMVLPVCKNFPLPLKRGKNIICVCIEFEEFDDYLFLPIYAKIVGNIVNQPIEPCMDYINENFIALKIGDTLSIYDAKSYETVYSLTGVETCGVGGYDDVFVMYRSVWGEYRIVRFYPNCLDVCSDDAVDVTFSECAIMGDVSVMEYYAIKANSLYRTVFDCGKIFTEKLPYKAKNVWVYNPGNVTYVYFVDLNGNYTLLELNYCGGEILKSYSLGKMKNAKIYNGENGLGVLYKTGEGLAERNLQDNSVKYIAVGDECLKIENDYLFIRRGNDIYKGE